MSLNTAGDLDRFAYKVFARAHCAVCRFRVAGLSSGATGAKARAHTRETGHKTIVNHDHITEYRKAAREDTLANELIGSLKATAPLREARP